MQQLTIDTFTKKYGVLPKRLQEALFAEETTDAMGKIQKEYRLDVYQIHRLARVTGLTMLGAAPVKEFVRNITNFVGVPEETARSLARDINEQVFQPVREELMAVHNISAANGLPMNNGGGGERREDRRTDDPNRESRITDSGKEEGVKLQDNEMRARRKELLERLKRSQEERGIENQESERRHQEANKEAGEEPGAGGGQSGTPKAVTTAWGSRTAFDGKKIDLTKIPPRREANGRSAGSGGAPENRNKNKKESRYVKLERGPDGFYYEV